MSRDQRPGRTQFFDSGARTTGAAAAPAAVDPAAALPVPGPSADASPLPVRTLAALFLVACGLGGAGVMLVIERLP